MSSTPRHHRQITGPLLTASAHAEDGDTAPSPSQPSGTRAALAPSARRHRVRAVRRGPHRINVHDHEGSGPAVLLLHGFPDNLHLYDRVVPLLEGQRTVLFDFLGWGRSDKPRSYPYTFANLTGDLDAVVDQLDIDRVLVVAHDISGTPAIDWALDHPDRVAGLVLLNTFYGPAPTLRVPEVIQAFSSPVAAVRRLARASTRWPWLFQTIYRWQLGTRLIRDRDVADTFTPRLMAQFTDKPTTKDPFSRLNEDLRSTIRASRERLPELRSFPRPVFVAFGARDYTLGPRVGEHLASQFPHSELRPILNAQHFPQLDEPEIVAAVIRDALAAAAANG